MCVNVHKLSYYLSYPSHPSYKDNNNINNNKYTDIANNNNIQCTNTNPNTYNNNNNNNNNIKISEYLLTRLYKSILSVDMSGWLYKLSIKYLLQL